MIPEKPASGGEQTGNGTAERTGNGPRRGPGTGPRRTPGNAGIRNKYEGNTTDKRTEKLKKTGAWNGQGRDDPGERNGNPGEQEHFSLRHIFLDVDGPVVTFLTKTGELILLGLVWLLTSLPVVTIGTSTIALYHAVVKSVRHDRGYPVREYFKAFRQHLKKGIIASVILLIWTAGLVVFDLEAAHVEQSLKPLSAKILVILVIITLAIAAYLFPILSRFRVSVGQGFMMAFIISGQHFIVTLLHLAALTGLVYLSIYIIPILALLFLPAFWVFLSSLLMERVLRDYMPEIPEKKEGTYGAGYGAAVGAGGEERDLWMYE